ncbi:hypothetical protein [Flavobacterium sp. NKUCC04_CG]|uniref:hypothetical protein n=1 Tax=Flavobacterium sp. NKUCC04_CG TaxID=2842121 RepID=UPI001C5B95EB|nr:hypothetical protein [Flavobacterium sp. NKUCC04_CG]MBW3519640.1 hypothetical protein [Flavobacterium sp. NKUCC04_CG]
MQRNVSIIISDYLSTACLQKVFLGYCTQTYRNFELIVVVPSRDESKVSQLLAAMEKQVFFPVHILISEKQLAMKEIIENVTTDFLIISEGNCIPRQDFIAQHFQNREEGYWLQGSVDKVSQAVFNRIDEQSIYTGVAFQNKWLKKQGGSLSFFNGPLYQWGWKAALYTAFSFSDPKLNLKNASFWKSDLRFLEAENQFELQRHLNSLKKLKVKRMAYRTTVLTLEDSV